MIDTSPLPIHPAAALFPELPDDELRDLADDIKKNGLLVPIVLYDGQILDGRNGLKACKLAGVTPAFETRDDVDPFDFVLSVNLKRRHLTTAQRREVISKVLKQRPEQSNRRVAEQTQSDHKTVGTVRDDLERRGEIPHVATRQDAKGRAQSSQRKPAEAGERPSANGPAKSAKSTPKSAKPHPNYPASSRLERWLQNTVQPLCEIFLEYGGFRPSADIPGGWNPETKRTIVNGLQALQVMVRTLLNKLEPSKETSRKPDPFDDLLSGIDSIFANYMAKEKAACKVLGIPWPPTVEAVERAFRLRAAKEHPDRFGDKAKFQDLNNARDCLLDYLQKGQAK